MIDAVFKYATKQNAINDLLAHTGNNDGLVDFVLDHVLPNLQIWRDSQDVISTGTSSDGSTFPITTHTYLPGYFVLVSSPIVIPSLSNDPALQIAIDRDTNTILKRNITLTLLQDLRFSPVFAGCSYPWGNW